MLPPLNLYLYSVAFSISLGSTPATLCMKGMTSSSHRSFASTVSHPATYSDCGRVWQSSQGVPFGAATGQSRSGSIVDPGSIARRWHCTILLLMTTSVT